jgi:hypothetical protein
MLVVQSEQWLDYLRRQRSESGNARLYAAGYKRLGVSHRRRNGKPGCAEGELKRGTR